MSLEKYIFKKIRLINIVGLNLTEYCNCLRENLLSVKDRKHLYMEMLNMPRISSGLKSIGYDHVNSMIFDINTPGSSQHRSEYSRFVEWCSTSADSSANKMHETISNLRAFYFIDGDVTLSDIETVVNERCISIIEKFTVVSDALRSDKKEWSSDVLMMEAEENGKIKIVCDDGSIVVDYKEGRFSVDPIQDMSHDCSIACDLLKYHVESFGNYFFTAKSSQRNFIQESVRKMYLGKPFQPLKYGMSVAMPSGTKDDIWRMFIKNCDVKYQFGSYRMVNESVRPRTVQLESI
jgi:hypothetical protein